MGMAEVVDPRLLIEADDVDDERVAVPVADGVTEIRRIQRVAVGMRPSIHVDLTPDMGGSLEHHDDALLFGDLDDFHRVRSGHQARAAGRQAVPFRIVFRLVLRVVVVDGRGPRLERHLRLTLRAPPRAAARAFSASEWSISASAAAPAPALGQAAFHGRRAVRFDDPLAHVGDVRNAPHAFLARDASEVRRAVGQPGRWLRRSGRPASSTTPAGGWRLLRADAPERRQPHGDHRAEDHVPMMVSHVDPPAQGHLGSAPTRMPPSGNETPTFSSARPTDETALERKGREGRFFFASFAAFAASAFRS